MDSAQKAWKEATWTERLTLALWTALAWALFTAGSVVSANVTIAAGSLTGLLFAGFAFVALAPKISGSEQRRQGDRGR